MQVSLKRVPIRRDMAETLFVDVGEHEIPILAAVHGEARVQTDQIEATPELREIESARIEYERLSRLYGIDPTSGRAYVDVVYTTPRQFEQDLSALATPRRSKAAA